MRSNIILASLAFFAQANTQADDTSGIFIGNNTWETGFIEVDSPENDIFYWLLNSRQDPNSDPLVIWLTGGPGCSSEVGIFYENGPWRF